MMPAAKMFDPILGVDVHMIQPPGPVPPVPIPHPHSGILFDPMDLAPYVGATVTVGGIPRAVAGSGTRMIPSHIPIGGVFIKPPANDSELFMGSSTVVADGDPFSYLGLPLLSCWDVGMPPIPRPPRSLLPSMVLPTTVVLSVPSGVTVGGGPTVSMSAIAGRLGLGPILALYNFATTGNPLALLGLAGPALKGLKFLNKKFNLAKKSKCGRGVKLFNGKVSIGGDPVNLVTGDQFIDDIDDYIEPDGLFHFGRFYSTAKRDRLGPLGYGFTHRFEQQILITRQVWRYTDHEDVEIDFEPLSEQRTESRLGGMVLRRVGQDLVELERRGFPRLRFSLPTDRQAGRARLVQMIGKDRRLDLHYENERLVAASEGDPNWPIEKHIRFVFQYSDGGLLTTVFRQAKGNQETLCRYIYDHNRQLLIESKDVVGRRTFYKYDDHRLMVWRQDPGGYQFIWKYDDRARCIETSGQDGLWACQMEYFPEKRETHHFQNGKRWIFRYDHNQRMIEKISPDGTVVTREIDERGNVVREVDAGGRELRWLYDETGVHNARADLYGNIYPPDLEFPILPDPTAPKWPETRLECEQGAKPEPEAGFGAGLALVRRLSDGGQRFAQAIIRFRRPKQDELSTIEQKDRLGRVIERIDPHGRRQKWEFSHSEHPVRYRDADGKIHRRETDRWNLITAEIDPLGHKTQYAYNSREEVTEIRDPMGSVTRYSYDEEDRVTRVERGSGIEDQYRYDARGCLVERLDGEGNTLVEIDYDDRALPASKRLASGETHELKYDLFANPIDVSTDAHKVEIARDKAGQVISDSVDGNGVEHSRSHTFRTSTFFGRFHVEIDPIRVGNRRDPARDGKRFAGITGLEITDPTGGSHRVYRDDTGMVLREHQSGTTELSQFNDHGQCDGRVLTRKTSDGAEVVHGIRYTHTAEGNLVEVADSIRGHSTFEYDDAHRLIKEKGPSGNFDFIHDAAGNVVEKPGLGGVRIGLGNQLMAAQGATFTYNNRFHIEKSSRAGRETRYFYDSLDMLVRIDDEADDPWTAEYDAWGRRLRCGRGEKQTSFFWNGEHLAAEVSPEGRLRLYIYSEPGALLPILFVDYESIEAEPERGRVYSVFYDQSGLPNQIEAADGRVVWWARRADPYGELDIDPSSEIEFNLRWPGHYHDAETGLHYNRYRYYSPKLGRYLQSDPIGQEGGINIYAYPSNPLRDVDILGLKKGSCGSTGGGKANKSKKPKKPAKKPQNNTRDSKGRRFKDLSPAEQKARRKAHEDYRKGLPVVNGQRVRVPDVENMNWDPKKKRLHFPEGSQAARDADELGAPRHVDYDSQGDPDFSKFNHEDLGGKQADIDDFTSDRDSNMRQAREDVRDSTGEDDWPPPPRNGNGTAPEDWTWHEKRDQTGALLVPSSVHDAAPHTGGVSGARAQGR